MGAVSDLAEYQNEAIIRVNWEPDDSEAWVIAAIADVASLRIGRVHYNGNAWMLTRIREGNDVDTKHLDDGKDGTIAGIAAKIACEEWWIELCEDVQQPQPVSRNARSGIAPASPHDVPDPDVKARRNYKRMGTTKLIDSYRQLVMGGVARRRTIDWQADIPFVEDIMREKGLDSHIM